MMKCIIYNFVCARRYSCYYIH